MQNVNKCSPLLIAGPSGAGKGTIVSRLLKCFPSEMKLSVSHTTRQPRSGEKNGHHYHFVGVDEFKKMISGEEFLEWACVHGNYYGTSRAAANIISEAQKICLLEVDVQGFKQIKSKLGKDAYYLFIAPPNIKILEERLRKRGTENDETISIRLKNALVEMELQSSFDRTVINDNLENCFSEILKLINKWYSHASAENIKNSPIGHTIRAN
eukprot:GHVL01024244.1.p1 GENE.GHVL01024244.1~~GHVL01024244.1.p1  ORF type:complete len:211 (+),score=33.17 GHVL01024244.1:20-652(+)